MSDTFSTIKRSAGHFFSGTLISRITGMVRDISMAYAFGIRPALAAFMIAYRFAHLLRRMFGEGALQSAFIPQFESLRSLDEKRAFTFFRDLTFNLTSGLLLLVCIGEVILITCFFRGNFSPGNNEIILLTLIMLPGLIPVCLYGLNASLLQCQKQYFLSSAAPAVFNIVWIAAVLCLQSVPAEKAMPMLAVGVVCAAFCQWLMTIPSTRSPVKDSLSEFSLRTALRFRSPDLSLLIKPLSLGILGVSASQINNAIDALFARYASAEGPAILWYAIRIQQLPLALFGIAIAGAVLPPLSRALKARRKAEFMRFLEYALLRTWNLMLPITLLLFVAGDACIALIYGRGDFGAEAVIETTRCLWAYGFGLLPTALVLVLAPASYAQSNYRLPALVSLLTLILNLCMNSIFIFSMGLGAVSVAFATGVSSWANLFFLSFYLSKTGFRFLSVTGEAIQVTCGSVSAFAGVCLFRIFFPALPFFADSLLFHDSLIEKMLSLLLLSGLFAGIFTIGFWMTRPKSRERHLEEELKPLP